ncbi:terminase large subunit domain-containing protein [Aeromonas salmonicida]|uniref:terminase large subunit domain-containing protein n=1 Tax=Aeromonas salmonicida TaxID=645 RepID=UPI00259E1DBA|nr:terminase large subunit [Aeromonas salmonicida]MDM5112807.1 terminase large subunit [Aeromonas salmonicida]
MTKNVDIANGYAFDVVRGKIPACRYVIQACQRHLDDLARQYEPSFPFLFDSDKANRAATFIQLLPHTKGDWAYRKLLLSLQPWQMFIICSVFGWVRKGSGLRRFEQSYTETPRKNGNTTLAGAVGLSLLADDESVADVRVAAPTQQAAYELFGIVKQMVSSSDILRDQHGVKALVGGACTEGGGLLAAIRCHPRQKQHFPTGVIVDNYQDLSPHHLGGVVIDGDEARANVVQWMQSTAGSNVDGPCYDKRREVIEMLAGTVPDDELFGIIYTIDEGDDWADPAVLAKANPNMGVSVYAEYLLAQQAKASRTAIDHLFNGDDREASFVDLFKAKHLNIWPKQHGE